MKRETMENMILHNFLGIFSLWGGMPNIGSDVANWPCDVGTDVVHAANVVSDIARPCSDVAYDIQENTGPLMTSMGSSFSR